MRQCNQPFANTSGNLESELGQLQDSGDAFHPWQRRMLSHCRGEKLRAAPSQPRHRHSRGQGHRGDRRRREPQGAASSQAIAPHRTLRTWTAVAVPPLSATGNSSIPLFVPVATPSRPSHSFTLTSPHGRLVLVCGRSRPFPGHTMDETPPPPTSIQTPASLAPSKRPANDNPKTASFYFKRRR